jgi:two-component system phosphate regulon sensor histidine kinase PhoR
MKFKKSVHFAFWFAITVSVIAAILLVLVSKYYTITLATEFILVYSSLLFLFTFLFANYNIEQFIFKRIQKIYEKLKLDKQDLDKKIFSTNIESLSEEIERFANTKFSEIALLKERENYRKEFLGNVSHELKTPIFTIQGYIDTLLDGAINDEFIREKYLERAQKGVERLSFIVNDLAMISRLESGDLKLNKTAFDIINTIQNVLDSLEIKANLKNLKMGFNKSYDIPIFVFADEERIEQVLQNLINNAVNYTNNDTEIIISIQYHNENKIQIDITDQGDGISQEDQVRLFERFYRVEKSRSRDQGGTGLGLSIVKHILEAHQETVFVNSELKKGATFSFTLETV